MPSRKRPHNYTAPVTAGIYQPNGQSASFVVSLFGVPMRDLMISPNGAWPIKQALGKTLVGEGFMGSPYAIEEN